MTALESLQADDFQALLETAFQLHAGPDQTVELSLIEVRKLGHRRPEVARDPFALTFRGASNWRLPQGIHRLDHPQAGSLEIFITQVGDGPGGSLFEAIFT